MPCYDGRNDNRTVYVDREIPVYTPTPEQQMKHEQTKDLNRYYTGLLCALLNDLKIRGIYEDVIKTASNDGSIDFERFFTQHEAEDVTRLKEHLLDYSEHEKELLLKILKGEK